MKKRKRKKKIVIFGISLVLIVALVLLMYFGPIVTFKKSIEFDSKIKTSDLVSGLLLGKVEEKEISLTKLGEQKIKVTTKSWFNYAREYEVKVVIKDTKGPIIEVKDPIKTEINGDIEPKKEIKVTDNFTKDVDIEITGDYKLDTLGEYELQITAKDQEGNVSSKKITLKVEDTVPPVITFEKNIVTTVGNKLDLSKLANASDNSKEKIIVKVSGDYDFNKVGSYKLKYVAEDSSGNVASQDFTLQVTNKNTNNKTITTKKGYVLTIKDGVASINGIVIANKTYSLPKNYGNGLTKETTTAFQKMQKAIKEEGLNLYIASGFRSYETQVAVYNDWVKQDGKALADTYSARPGHSEHQTGLAMDVNLIKQSFANTKEYAWLQANAYKYGFILRYPKNKQNITGYIYEPWHYRFVGESLAKELYNNGNWLTLEEYFGIDSKYQ